MVYWQGAVGGGIARSCHVRETADHLRLPSPVSSYKAPYACFRRAFHVVM
jgi:hypothetical protein